MVKFVKVAAIVAGCLGVAMMAASPAAAYWGKRHGHTHVNQYDPEQFIAKYGHKYPPRFRKDHRPDCRQFKHRARLTGSAYWRYAAYSCRHDHYLKQY